MCELAKELNVKPSSVNEMLKKLRSENLVTYERYGLVNLTQKGEEIANLVEERHRMLVGLLKALGVPDDVAERDACVMEHLSSETIEGLRKVAEMLGAGEEASATS